MITPQQLYEKNNIKQYYTAHNAIVSIVNDKVSIQTDDKLVEVNMSKTCFEKYLTDFNLTIDQIGAIDVYEIQDNKYGDMIIY